MKTWGWKAGAAGVNGSTWLSEAFPAEADAGACLSNSVLEWSLVGGAGRGRGGGAGGSVMRPVPRAGKWMVPWLQGHPRMSATSCVTLGK